MEQVIYDEECFRARAPVLPGYSGIGMIGPTLIEWGTEEQRRRFVPRILSAEDIWCQGFSEPGAGRISPGSRPGRWSEATTSWSTGRRCGPRAPSSRTGSTCWSGPTPRPRSIGGISYLLVDMRSPGITVRPLVLMNGHRHFNEVFFVDVAVPRANLVGPLHQGWKVAMTTLMYERKAGGGRGYAEQLARLLASPARCRSTAPPPGRIPWSGSASPSSPSSPPPSATRGSGT